MVKYVCFVKIIRYRLLMLLICILGIATVQAQEDSARIYTEQNPLIYEDSWDLWPYSYLNDNGEPDGFNIDLIKMLMEELNIPYVIKLKSQQEAFDDLKAGMSDLTLGLAVGFHDAYGLYGKNAITLFTQSLVSPKDQPVKVKTFRDLSKSDVKVIVNDSSLCHHLMLDYNWENHAIVEKDMREAIQEVSTNGEGMIVWNTLSLKWLMRRYQIENLQLTPVNMPHGEYKFMSNDQALLDRLDEAYSKLYTADMLTPIQTKWFYPDQKETEKSRWLGILSWLAVLLVVIAIVYMISYRVQRKHIKRNNNKLNRRLALILQTCEVRIWTYNPLTNKFSWRNENGQIAYTYTMEEFSQRYSPKDFQRLKGALNLLASQIRKEETKGKKDDQITIELKAKDVEGGDQELHDFIISLSVLSRDQKGKPTMIVGTKKDVTADRRQHHQEEERTLRYWSIFHTPVLGIILFDKDGKLVNINQKACEIYGCTGEEVIRKHVDMKDFFNIDFSKMDDLNNFAVTQILDIDGKRYDEYYTWDNRTVDRRYRELHLLTVYNDSKELMGLFAICRDVTDYVRAIKLRNEKETRLKVAKATLSAYDKSLADMLHESDVRKVTYSPQSHTLKILRDSEEVQHALTQTRCMTLIDEHSQKTAMRALNDMDSRADKSFNVSIRTTLRLIGNGESRRQLELLFCLMPLHDMNGQVTDYIGLLRDVSELRLMEQQLAIEVAKVQEVEHTKNSFVKNMVQDIRHPMETVVSDVALIDDEKPVPEEAELQSAIIKNAEYLIHLINNILFLSRLEARMVEINKQPCNYAIYFDEQCLSGWGAYQNPETKYVIENPYEELVVDIDAENLSYAIKQITSNAAKHTKTGTVKARYEYIGRRLVISVDDTGTGIPQQELQNILESDSYGIKNTKGLGLAITKELVRQMGGYVDITSEEGTGTTVYITIPCHASVIKRKKLA